MNSSVIATAVSNGGIRQGHLFGTLSAIYQGAPCRHV